MKEKKHPYSADDVSPMNCIICGTDIKLIEHDSFSAGDPKQGMWRGGIVNEMSAGYGSKHDGDVILFALCDKCIDKKLKNGEVIYLYDYMSNYISNDAREDYNKKLHNRIAQRKRESKIKRILNKN